jgi:hypothetical protein
MVITWRWPLTKAETCRDYSEHTIKHIYGLLRTRVFVLWIDNTRYRMHIPTVIVTVSSSFRNCIHSPISWQATGRRLYSDTLLLTCSFPHQQQLPFAMCRFHISILWNGETNCNKHKVVTSLHDTPGKVLSTDLKIYVTVNLHNSKHYVKAVNCGSSRRHHYRTVSLKRRNRRTAVIYTAVTGMQCSWSISILHQAEAMFSYRNFFYPILFARGSVVVKALCYKPESREFDTRWGNF